ncbi:uncharacterized protein H6S33_006531 [Morchella sextelata]|uniref:uncharacterized protein n=1 Tax=Morchella sextelata TaxID=1174677 RepID=UPI001D05709B|nr:uncharacterized protein H6S33_006531 [Morchella sextelata]KAH0604863.1 hypothetical protein H6S33_006531 [Morchella sextelata]
MSKLIVDPSLIQWIVLNLISFRVLDGHLVLRLDTRPPGLYYREWWWKIGRDITYKFFSGGGENTYMDAMFLRRHVDFVARLCPNGFPESEAARRLDILAHTIGAKMKAGLVMEEEGTRNITRETGLVGGGDEVAGEEELFEEGVPGLGVRLEEGLIYQELASDAALGRLPGMGIVRAEE